MQITVECIGKTISENFPIVDANKVRRLMLAWGLRDSHLENLKIQIHFSSEVSSSFGLIWLGGENWHIILSRESMQEPNINQIAIHELRHLYWFLYQLKILCRDRKRCDTGSQDDCYDAEKRYKHFTVVHNFQLSFPFPKC